MIFKTLTLLNVCVCVLVHVCVTEKNSLLQLSDGVVHPV